jgi:hypothetical protein
MEMEFNLDDRCPEAKGTMANKDALKLQTRCSAYYLFRSKIFF